MTSHATPQEQFWAGKFGTDYIARNRSDALLASNLAFFSSALKRAGPIASCTEIGANVGMNLKALRLLHPGTETGEATGTASCPSPAERIAHARSFACCRWALIPSASRRRRATCRRSAARTSTTSNGSASITSNSRPIP